MRPLAGELAAWPTPISERLVKWAEIDTAAIAANAAELARIAGAEVGVLAVVKANGYGHGAGLAARAALAGGAIWLGVSNAEEALQLRSAGIEAPLLVLGWTPPAAHAALIAAGVDLTVFDEVSLASIEAAAAEAGRRARLHLKVDTGMNRLGVAVEAAPALLEAIVASARVELTGLSTHFSDADGPLSAATEEQHARFLPLVGRARAMRPEVLVHTANSAATLRFPWTHHDLVRPGLALYGYLPAHCEGLAAVRPAMTVAASVTHVTTVAVGETVGYNRRWTAERSSRVAVVAAGYADGIMRSQSNSGAVVIGGCSCRIVGMVSMDQISVDVTDAGPVEAGDEAILLGGDDRRGFLGADEVARSGGTSSWEVLCAVSARVPRLLVGEGG